MRGPQPLLPTEPYLSAGRQAYKTFTWRAPALFDYPRILLSVLLPARHVFCAMSAFFRATDTCGHYRQAYRKTCRAIHFNRMAIRSPGEKIAQHEPILRSNLPDTYRSAILRKCCRYYPSSAIHPPNARLFLP